MATLDEFRRQAEEAFRPTLDFGLGQIQLQEQGLGQQEVGIGREYDRLIKQLLEGARASQGSLEERNNQLGLLQSGLTASGLGKIQSDLFQGQKETAQDRVAKLADLALQRSGLGLKRAELQQSYQQSVAEMVQKLLDQQEAERQRQEAAKKSAASAGGLGSGTAKLLSSLLTGGSKAASPVSLGQVPQAQVAQPNLRDASTLDLIRYFRSTGEFNNQEITDLVSALQAGFAGDRYQSSNQKVIDTLNELAPLLGLEQNMFTKPAPVRKTVATIAASNPRQNQLSRLRGLFRR